MKQNTETRLRFAYQGEPGAYGEIAILHRFGSAQVVPVPQPTFVTVVQAVAEGNVDGGVLPVRNTTTGRIAEAAALLYQPDIQVAGYVWQSIRHCLLALPGQALRDIRQVRSHPQALAQCRAYLDRLGVEVIEAADTAGSARNIREQGMRGVAAIASERAAECYQLAILATDIQTRSNNATCFAILRPTKLLARTQSAQCGQHHVAFTRGQYDQAETPLRVMSLRQAEERGMRYAG